MGSINAPVILSNPLKSGYSREIVSANIAKLTRERKPRSVAIAAAYTSARDAWRKAFPRKKLPSHLMQSGRKVRRTMRKRNPEHGSGFYIMGKYSSLSWHATRAEAEKELKKILDKGAWSGVKPYIEPARKRNPHRTRVPKLFLPFYVRDIGQQLDVAAFSTKKEAVSFARKYANKYQTKVSVRKHGT